MTDLVFACRHRLIRTALVGAILSSGLVGITWSLSEPRFEAESLVHVREQQNVIFTPQTSRAEDASFFHSQEKLAISPQVLTAALNRNELAQFAGQLPDRERIDWLRNRMRVDIQSGSEVMTIAASHPSATLRKRCPAR